MKQGNISYLTTGASPRLNWWGNGRYDEVIRIELTRLSSEIQKLVFAITIYQAENCKQNFGMVSGAFIQIVDRKNNQEIARFDLSEDAGTSTAMIFREVYRHNEEWKFKAIGQGFSNGLASLTHNYGVTK